MKTARYLSIAMLGLIVTASGACADPFAMYSDVDPNVHLDADGNPLPVSLPQPKQLTKAEVDVIHKQEEKAAQDKNWLLIGYEKQLQTHADADSTENNSANLYYELSSNKELAKLAGLSELDLGNQQSTPSLPLRTGNTASDKESVGLRDTSSAATSAPASPGALGNLLKPLITPLSAPDAAGLHNFYSPLSVPMASPIFGSLPPTPTPPPKADQPEDSTDIESPGMVAAQKDPLMDPSTSDLSLEVLPGETPEQARERQDNNSSLELPVAMTSDLLHKAQAVTLSLPGVPATPNMANTAAKPATVKTAPLEDANAPLPVNAIPQINPVRSSIANPYDILDR